MRSREDLGKKGCVHQISAIKILVQKYLRVEKLYTIFMDLEIAYDTVDREAF